MNFFNSLKSEITDGFRVAEKKDVQAFYGDHFAKSSKDNHLREK